MDNGHRVQSDDGTELSATVSIMVQGPELTRLGRYAGLIIGQGKVVSITNTFISLLRVVVLLWGTEYVSPLLKHRDG